jgi:effector-binding domain-containing protein
MTQPHIAKTFASFALSMLLLAACTNNTADKPAAADTAKKDTATPAKNDTPAQRPPIINITDTVSVKQTILCMKDSAADFDRIGLKLQEMYGTLSDAISLSKIKVTGQPMAWYRGNKAPFFFEAGIPVDKRPARLPKHTFIKETGSDSVTVAHFYGPYSMLPMAYEALDDYMKSRKKTSGKPYEIYVDDPVDEKGNMKDPYKVRTDIILPWH